MSEQPQTTEPSMAPAAAPQQARPPLAFATRRFLVRTGVMCVLSILFVAMLAAVYVNHLWAGVYLAAAAWSTAFFTFTALAMIRLAIEHRIGAGMVCVFAKLLLLAFALFAIRHWLDGQRNLLVGTALIAGISSPLIVAGLRFAGAAMTPGNRIQANAGGRP